jgi:hypothetical protein
MRAKEDGILERKTPIGLWDRLEAEMVNETGSYSTHINWYVGCHCGIVKDSLGTPTMTHDCHSIHINYVSSDVIASRYCSHF